MEHCMTCYIWITPAHHLSSSLLFKQLTRPARRLFTSFSKSLSSRAFRKGVYNPRGFLLWKYQWWLKLQYSFSNPSFPFICAPGFSNPPNLATARVASDTPAGIHINPEDRDSAPHWCVLSGMPLFRFLFLPSYLSLSQTLSQVCLLLIEKIS